MVSLALIAMFVAFEPNISRAISSQFEVTATVTAEIAFQTAASDITLAPIPGLTGGTSTSQTTVIVTTNNAAGYNMTLTSSSSPAMQGDTTAGTIPDYTPTSGTIPDYSWGLAVNTAELGYTVEASTTADLDPSFQDNGSACNAGGGQTIDRCWLNASTTAETIINTSGASPASGSTSTIKFRLTIMPNPIPAVPQDTYTATNTLTATVN